MQVQLLQDVQLHQFSPKDIEAHSTKAVPTSGNSFLKEAAKRLRSKCTMFLEVKSSTTQAIVLSSSSPEALVPKPVSAKERLRREGWFLMALHKGTCHFTPTGKPDNFSSCKPFKLGAFKSCRT